MKTSAAFSALVVLLAALGLLASPAILTRAAADAASDSCCTMSRDALVVMIGTNDECPTWLDNQIASVKKCSVCPTGKDGECG